MHHGVEVSRLDAMDHGAELLDAGNIASDVELTWQELGAAYNGAELPTTYQPTTFATVDAVFVFSSPLSAFFSKNRARIWIQYCDHQKFDLFHRS